MSKLRLIFLALIVLAIASLGCNRAAQLVAPTATPLPTLIPTPTQAPPRCRWHRRNRPMHSRPR